MNRKDLIVTKNFSILEDRWAAYFLIIQITGIFEPSETLQGDAENNNADGYMFGDRGTTNCHLISKDPRSVL